MNNPRQKARRLADTALLFLLCLGFLAILPIPGHSQDKKLARQALQMPFELLTKSDFGPRTSIKNLIARDDVRGVAVTFVASFIDSFERTAPEIDKLYRSYRSRGVVILISVEPSSGSKAIKRILKDKDIKAPVSLTGKQWNPFQNLAGEKNHNSWPWTFYVDKKGTFVEITQGTPRATMLNAIAGEEGTGPAEDTGNSTSPIGNESLELRIQSLAEIHVTRPKDKTWTFEGIPEPGSPFGRILLVKPKDNRGAPGLSGGMRTGVEILAYLEHYEAIVLVGTLDRKVHTGFGTGAVVDPGSKSQIMSAQLALFEQGLSKVAGAQKASNSRLGGQNAGRLKLIGVTSSKEKYDINAYCVPLRNYTYLVTFAHPKTAGKEIKSAIAEIRKAIRFERGRS